MSAYTKSMRMNPNLYKMEAIPYVNRYIVNRTVYQSEIVIDLKRLVIHRLNAMGRFILRHIDNKKTVKDISRIVADKFDVSITTAQRDCVLFFKKLYKNKIIDFRA